MARNHRLRLSRVELIVIIVIAAVLVAVLVPVFSRAREYRRQMSCMQNLKQIGVSFKMYASDWNGMYPPKKRVLTAGDPSGDRYKLVPEGTSIYPRYVQDLKPLVCPSDEMVSRLPEECQHLIKGGASPDVIHNLIDDSSYIYTGYAAYSGDYGTFVNDAESQFLGFVRAIDELGWKDFDSDITVPEESVEQYRKYTTRHSGTIYRLREGIGKLLVTDASNAALVSTAESQCAVMWDKIASRSFGSPGASILLTNHVPAGSSVLYLDGHAEFARYPGKFPVTRGVAEAIGNLELAVRGVRGHGVLRRFDGRERPSRPVTEDLHVRITGTSEPRRVLP